VTTNQKGHLICLVDVRIEIDGSHP
jgi:hypothetical protein